eukprot:5659267-Lingulodinium_polyedra.AAC.1
MAPKFAKTAAKHAGRWKKTTEAEQSVLHFKECASPVAEGDPIEVEDSQKSKEAQEAAEEAAQEPAAAKEAARASKEAAKRALDEKIVEFQNKVKALGKDSQEPNLAMLREHFEPGEMSTLWGRLKDARGRED